MVKLIFTLRRLPTLSRAEFQRYWLGTHGPLVRERAKVLRIQRYVQVHTIDDALNAALRESRGGPEEYDGVAELWWKSADDLREAFVSDEGQKAARELLEDEKKFIDLARSPLWIGKENPIIGG